MLLLLLLLLLMLLLLLLLLMLLLLCRVIPTSMCRAQSQSPITPSPIFSCVWPRLAHLTIITFNI
jgi:hypothetical protein